MTDRTRLIKDNTSWLILAFMLFAGAAFLSYSAFLHEPEYLTILKETIMSTLKELGEAVFQGNRLQGAAILFAHNFFTLIRVIAFGIALGILPLISALGNGAVLGAVSAELALSGSAPVPFLAAGILPHGIFEIPAFLLSTALGLKLGYHVVFPLPGLNRRESLRLILREVAVALPIIAILLMVAALIEVFITPGVLRHILPV